jgi:hypothetical protein
MADIRDAILALDDDTLCQGEGAFCVAYLALLPAFLTMPDLP